VGGASRVDSGVRIAFFSHDAVILGVFAGHQIRESALAALAVGRAADDILRREIDSHLVLGGHSQSGFQHAQRGEGVTAAAAPLVPAIESWIYPYPEASVRSYQICRLVMGRFVPLTCWFDISLKPH